MSSMTIPLQSPSTWPAHPFDFKVPVDVSFYDRDVSHMAQSNPQRQNPYHSSAILSAHIESSTLPLRYVKSFI
jgi:hypothetical protein